MSIDGFVFDKVIKVDTLDIKWDIYWMMEDDGPEYSKVLHDANDSLTRAAIAAIEENKPDIFYSVANSLASLGAADSEPLWQFKDLWKEAYGEVM